MPGPKAGKNRRYKGGYRRRKGSRGKTLKQRTAENTRKINKIARNTFPISRFQITDTGVINSFSHVKLLTQPNNWNDVFRTESVPGTDLPRQYDLTHVKTKWACQTEDSTTGNVWLQIMIVSLKPKTAAKVIERTTRLSNLDENVDYIYVSAGSTPAAL